MNTGRLAGRQLAGRSDAPKLPPAAGATGSFEIFLVATPGLEEALLSEVIDLKFAGARVIAGGVMFTGGWRDVWRANLEIRGATRVLARIGSFRALHLAQLDKRAHQFAWKDFLRPAVPVRVEASCARSRIYHSGAAAQRIAAAIRDGIGAPAGDEAAVRVLARIEDDVCTLSIDTTGESLHKRGHKEETGKAPMRETMAALFLRQCGFNGREPVVDPMCGSGTFIIEAAEMAAGFKPGRTRHFAFEQLAAFDAAAWRELRASCAGAVPDVKFFGSDRDAGAIRMSRANAERAGVAAFAEFRRQAVSDLAPPAGPPGLVIVNPPYGARIGGKKPLYALYGALGKTLLERFGGWRVGLITSDAGLATAAGLPFEPPGRSVLHGGLRIRLFRTSPLPIK